MSAASYIVGRHPKGRVATTQEAQARFRDNSVEDVNGCRIWQRQFIQHDGKRGGYGLAHTPKGWGLPNKTTAHRVSWLLFRGGIPEGAEVCHRCDVRLCVNPDHLFLGSSRGNTVDMIDKDRHPDCMWSKLYIGDVARMVEMRERRITWPVIAKTFDISISYASVLVKMGTDPMTAVPNPDNLIAA